MVDNKSLLATSLANAMIPIDVNLVPALLALVAGPPPATPFKLTLANVRWGNSPCPYVNELEVTAAGELLLEAEPPNRTCLIQSPSDWKSGIFTADIPDHGTLEVQEGLSHMTNFHMDGTGTRIAARLEGFRWHALRNVTDSKNTALWACILDLSPNVSQLLWLRRGNLAIRVAERTIWGWRLRAHEGQIFLVPTDDRDRWTIAFELVTHAGVPDTDGIAGFLAALSFVLGIQLHVNLLHAVGDDGIQPGLICPGIVDLRTAKRGTQQSAIPGESMREWLPKYIECAVAALREEGSPLLVALHLHAGSIDGFVDTQFLLSWIASEAIANWGLRNKRFTDHGMFRIADEVAWSAWVKQHEQEIKDLALPGKEANLLMSVTNSKGSRGSPIQRMFAGAGLPWTTAMEEAERVRNMVAHEGTTHGTSQRDWQKDLDLVEFARTVLTAAIALLIGYDGPINDRVKDPATPGPDVPSWWEAAAPASQVIYECSR